MNDLKKQYSKRKIRSTLAAVGYFLLWLALMTGAVIFIIQFTKGLW